LSEFEATFKLQQSIYVTNFNSKKEKKKREKRKVTGKIEKDRRAKANLLQKLEFKKREGLK
jgi:hypothetical protein